MPYKNKVTGIYKITNTINNKCYIGGSVNVMSRFAVHKHLLTNNKHFNSYLQLCWNNCGILNFKFNIIEKCSKSNLREREDHYIEFYNSNNRKSGYNVRLKCDTNLGIKATEATKKKLRESHLGNKHTEESKLKISKSQFKPVCQLDMDLNVVNSFSSIKEASEVTGLCSRSISLCTTKKMHAHPRNKFHWCFKEEVSTFTKPIYKQTWKKRSQ